MRTLMRRRAELLPLLARRELDIAPRARFLWVALRERPHLVAGVPEYPVAHALHRRLKSAHHFTFLACHSITALYPRVQSIGSAISSSAAAVAFRSVSMYTGKANPVRMCEMRHWSRRSIEICDARRAPFDRESYGARHEARLGRPAQLLLISRPSSSLNLLENVKHKIPIFDLERP